MNQIELATVGDIGRIPTHIRADETEFVESDEALLRLDYTIEGHAFVKQDGQLVTLSYLELSGQITLEDGGAVRFQN